MAQRFRITYARTEALRYIGHLDMQKIWERYVRRLKVPIAYSQGFHPQAKLQQACPLPLGILSTCEVIDVWVDNDEETPNSLLQALMVVPQPGIEINHIERIELYSPALTTQISHARYTAWLFDPFDPAWLQSEIDRILNASELIRERRGKPYNLRALITELTLEQLEGHNQLNMLLTAQPSATGRPEAVLAEIGIDPYGARYTRTEILFRPLHENETVETVPAAD